MANEPLNAHPDNTAPFPSTWPAMSIAQAHSRLTAPGSPFEMIDVTVRGVPLRAWKNVPATMRELFVNARQAFGERLYLVHDDERITVEAFARASLALAAELQAQGVRRGDRVVIGMRNLPEFPVAAFATMLLGAIATPLNAWGSGQELLYGLVDSGAKIAIMDDERWSRVAGLRDQAPALNRVLICRRTDHSPLPGQTATLESVIGTPHQWAGLPDRPLPVLTPELAPDDDAMIFYTSGTTGAAKGALGTHRCSTNALLMGAFSTARSYLRRGEPLPDPAARQTQLSTLVAVPFFHTTGCQVLLFGALYAGAKLVLMRRWDPERAFALIQAERITSAGGVPTIAWELIEHPRRADYDLSSLESVAYGGAPSSTALVTRILQTLPHAQPGMGWGMTETSATVTNHSAEDYRYRPDSAGPAVPVCDMKIIDDEGHEVITGGVGELVVRGPNVIKAYWNKPVETAATLVDGWLRTGDIARIDEEGFLYIVDRKKNMMIRGGENIYNAEIEEVLCRHPALMDAGVVALPHPTLGEEPAAVVMLKPGAAATEPELQAFVREHLAPFKVPVRIVVQADRLPRNPTGKLIKHALREMIQGA